MQQVKTEMSEKGIYNNEWINRKKWRRKIKCKAQKEVNRLIRYT